MSGVGVLAPVVAVVVLLLPSATPARLGALARVGRLHLAAAEADPRARAPRWPARRTSVPAAVAVELALVALAGPAAGIEALIVLGVAAVLVRDLRRGRASSARLAELRSVVGLLESELQAGTPPPTALAAAAEAGPLLARALTATPGADAVQALVDNDDPDLRRLGVTWRVGESTGMPLAEVLATFGADLASAAEQQRAVSVALAGPQASAALLCCLPVLGVGLGIAMGAHPLALLFGTPGGQALTCAGLLLDAAGVLWVRRILSAARGARE